MKLLVYATHSEGYFELLKKQAMDLGYDLVVIGWGSSWKGFFHRFHLYVEYLRELENPKELVVINDAFDVLVLRPPEEVETIYHQHAKPCLWMVENEEDKNLITQMGRFLFQPPSRWMSRRWNLNGGSYMGTVEGLLQILGRFLDRYGSDENNHTLDDQMIVNKHCEEPFFKDLVTLDHTNEIFGYCGSTNAIDRTALNYKLGDQDTIIQHRVTGKTPCFLVSVGGADMNPLTMPLFRFKSYRWMGYLMEKMKYDPRCLENVLRSHLQSTS